MRSQTLCITFIDSAVDIDENEIDKFKDYIGSARIPLSHLESEKTYTCDMQPINNHKN